MVNSPPFKLNCRVFMTITSALEEYVKHLKAIPCSFHTWKGNRAGVRQLVKLIGDRELSDITLKHIEAFRIDMVQRELSPFTFLHYICSLRSFFEFAEKLGDFAVKKALIELPPSPQNFVDLPTHKEISKMISLIDMSTTKGVRDRAVMELLKASGCRVSEISGLDEHHINLEKLEMKVTGKGNKTRICDITPRARHWVKKWLKKKPNEFSPLFTAMITTNQEHKADKDYMRMGIQSIQMLVRNLREAAHITKQITPHDLRHLYATDLIKNRIPVMALQQELGHAHLSSTQWYVHLDRSDVKRQYRRAVAGIYR